MEKYVCIKEVLDGDCTIANKGQMLELHDGWIVTENTYICTPNSTTGTTHFARIIDQESIDIMLLQNEIKRLVELSNSRTDYANKMYVSSNRKHMLLRTLHMLINETIKTEKGEVSCQSKFESIQKFAEYINMMIEIEINYTEKEEKGENK